MKPNSGDKIQLLEHSINYHAGTQTALRGCQV